MSITAHDISGSTSNWGGTAGSSSVVMGRCDGSVEICYATEPLPFGRYAHLEFLELGDDLLGGEVEEWVIDMCEARARGFDWG